MVMAAAAAAPAAKPTQEAEPAEEAPKKEQTSFDVKLVSYPPTSKVQLIKELRSVTQLGLMDAKQTIEKSGIVAKKLGKEEAEKLKGLFEKHQAKVEIV